MRQFASAGFRAWNLSLEAKVVYTGFCALSLLALVVSALFYEDLVGHDTAGVRSYYAGEAPREAASSPRPTPATAPVKGPAIVLPDAADGQAAEPMAPAGAGPITVAVTYRKLLEVTHFHLFTVPVFLLIIAHLFMLTGLSQRAKVAWIASSWLAAVLHLVAPWLLRYGGAGWAWTYPSSGAALGITCTVMTMYPVWAMWFGRPGAQAASGRTTPGSASSDANSAL